MKNLSVFFYAAGVAALVVFYLYKGDGEAFEEKVRNSKSTWDTPQKPVKKNRKTASPLSTVDPYVQVKAANTKKLLIDDFKKAANYFENGEPALACLVYNRIYNYYKTVSWAVKRVNVDGLSIDELYKQHQMSLYLQFKNNQDKLFEQIKDLHLNRNLLSRILLISSISSKEIYNKFKEMGTEIEKSQMSKATSAVFFKFDKNLPQYQETIFAAVKSAWPDNYPLQPSAELPTSYSVRNIAFKTVTVEVTEIKDKFMNLYKSDNNSIYNKEIPVGVIMRFIPISGSQTSWDKMTPIEVRLPAVLKSHKFYDPYLLNEVSEEQRAAIAKQLKEKLKTLPVLKIFPEIDLNQPAIVKGKLNQELLLALYYNDRKKYTEILTELKRLDTSIKSQLCEFIAFRRLKEEVPWLTKELRLQDDETRKTVITRSYAGKYLGDYSPMYAIAATADSTRLISSSLARLPFGDESHLKKVLELITDTKNTKLKNRVYLVHTLMSRLYYDKNKFVKISDYMEIMKDPEIDVKMAFMNSLSRYKESKLHSELFKQELVGASEEKQLKLILTIYSSAQTDKNTLNALKEMVVSTTSRKVLDKALYKISLFMRHQAGWAEVEKLSHIDSISKDSEFKGRVAGLLIFNSQFAHEDKGYKYLSEELLKSNSVITVARVLLGINNRRRDVLKLFDAFLKKPSKNKYDPGYILSSIIRRTNDKTWDFSLKEIHSIIGTTRKSSVSSVRKYSYQLMDIYNRKKAYDYSVILLECYNSEKDSSLKAILKKYLNK